MNRIEQRVKQINIAYITLMIALAIILAIRLNLFTDCPSCFFVDSLFNKAILCVSIGVFLGYIASIPIMIYKVRQSKKITGRAEDVDDCDEGSCSY